MAEAQVEQAVVDVAAVRREGRPPPREPPHDDVEGVDDRHAQDEEGDRHLGAAQDREEGQGVAQEHDAARADEDRRGVEVPAEEPQEGSRQGDAEQGHDRLAGRPRHADDPQGDHRDQADARREAVEAVDEVDAVDHPAGPDDHEDGAPQALQPDGIVAERVGDGPDRDPQPHRDQGDEELAAELPPRAEVEPIVDQAHEDRGDAPQQEGDDLRPGQRVTRAPEAHVRVDREERGHHDEEGDGHRHAPAPGHRHRVDAALVRLVDGVHALRQAAHARREDEGEDGGREERRQGGDEEARSGHRIVPGRPAVTPPAGPERGSGRRCRAPPP